MRQTYTRDQLMVMPLKLLRLIDITDGETEKLVQEVLNKRLVTLPPQGTVYRRDIPDIRDGETEAHWQKIINERTAKLRPQSLHADGVEEVTPPVEETPAEETAQEEVQIEETPVETPTAPEMTEDNNPEHSPISATGRFCDSCNGVRKHKIYCIKR